MIAGILNLTDLVVCVLPPTVRKRNSFTVSLIIWEYDITFAY